MATLHVLTLIRFQISKCKTRTNAKTTKTIQTDPAPKWKGTKCNLFLLFHILEAMDAVDAVDNDDGDDEIWMYTFYLVSIGFALFHLWKAKLCTWQVKWWTLARLMDPSEWFSLIFLCIAVLYSLRQKLFLISAVIQGKRRDAIMVVDWNTYCETEAFPYIAHHIHTRLLIWIFL